MIRVPPQNRVITQKIDECIPLQRALYRPRLRLCRLPCHQILHHDPWFFHTSCQPPARHALPANDQTSTYCGVRLVQPLIPAASVMNLAHGHSSTTMLQLSDIHSPGEIQAIGMTYSYFQLNASARTLSIHWPWSAASFNVRAVLPTERPTSSAPPIGSS